MAHTDIRSDRSADSLRDTGTLHAPEDFRDVGTQRMPEDFRDVGTLAMPEDFCNVGTQRMPEDFRDVGTLAMPENFRYRKVAVTGKPPHGGNDDFRVRHPHMLPGKRAKIFAPFDALRGFDAALLSKDIQYEDRRTLSSEDTDELNRRLALLQQLTSNSREARANHVQIAVTHFVPCNDPYNAAFQVQGRYVTTCGICCGIDLQTSEIVLLETPDATASLNTTTGHTAFTDRDATADYTDTAAVVNATYDRAVDPEKRPPTRMTAATCKAVMRKATAAGAAPSQAFRMVKAALPVHLHTEAETLRISLSDILRIDSANELEKLSAYPSPTSSA